jgi:GH24 family phage-related lysozyme (muramidase)
MSRLTRFFRRHKHAEETLAEAVGINIATRIVAAALAAGAASAAITAIATQTTTVYHPTAPLSTKGAAFIARNEGLRLVPYFDGAVACTVGVGHLIHYGGCTPYDYAHWTLTLPQAMTLLMHDAGRATACVHQTITRRITVPQDDALVDLTFNAGCGSLGWREPPYWRSIASLVNTGQLGSVPATLAHTATTAGGRYLPGLYTRRVAEGVLFKRGFYGAGIGYWTAPVPPAIAALRAKTGYWSWLAWRLGREAWKPYGHANPAVRPHVPRRVPITWWTRLHAFVAASK